MDKRKEKRIKKRIMAKVNNKLAILVDISRTGFKVSTAVVPQNRTVDVVLQADNREFNLKGYTCWINQKVIAPRMYDMGISVKEASSEYYEFLDRLLAQ